MWKRFAFLILTAHEKARERMKLTRWQVLKFLHTIMLLPHREHYPGSVFWPQPLEASHRATIIITRLDSLIFGRHYLWTTTNSYTRSIHLIPNQVIERKVQQ